SIVPLGGETYTFEMPAPNVTESIRTFEEPSEISGETTTETKLEGSSENANELSPPTPNLKWVVKGNASELGLNKLNGTNVTEESTNLMIKSLKSFIKGLPESSVKYDESLSRLKIGNLEKFGKEIRIGRDVKFHRYQHIDVQRNAIGKKYKDLNFKIETNPLIF